MLWVNLIMDSLGSLALATEPPYDNLLKRKPTKRNEFIINGKMCKHIILQSVVLIVLLILLYSYAPEFIKENNNKRFNENTIIHNCYVYYPGKDPIYIISGMESKWKEKNLTEGKNETDCGEYSKRKTLDLAYYDYIKKFNSTAHMTIIFNIFVFYILFNQINCRIIDDSFNIFKRIIKNYFFIIIIVLEIGLQILIIFLGGRPFHIVNQGLTGIQWGICIGFSAITFVISIIIKTIPLDTVLDKIILSKEKKRDTDPTTPVTNKNQMTTIEVNEKNNINIIDVTEDDNEDIISEKVNINVLDYDFNNKEKVKQKLIDKISSQSNLLKDETGIEKENNNHYDTNENNDNENEINNKIEEINKKYKIINNNMIYRKIILQMMKMNINL